MLRWHKSWAGGAVSCAEPQPALPAEWHHRRWGADLVYQVPLRLQSDHASKLCLSTIESCLRCCVTKLASICAGSCHGLGLLHAAGWLWQPRQTIGGRRQPRTQQVLPRQPSRR